MTTRFLHAITTIDGADYLPMLADMCIKATVALLFTWLIILAVRRWSASLRHLVWFSGVVGVLVLPILSVALPSWRILPSWVALDAATEEPVVPGGLASPTVTPTTVGLEEPSLRSPSASTPRPILASTSLSRT